MGTETKHTPGPWFAGQHGLGAWFIGVEVPCKGPCTAATRLADVQSGADAEFIVRACNCHDDLLDAAKDAEAVLMGLHDSGGEAAALAIASYPALVSVQAAIAKAEAQDG